MFHVNARAGSVPSSASARVTAEGDHVTGDEERAVGRREDASRWARVPTLMTMGVDAVVLTPSETRSCAV